MNDIKNCSNHNELAQTLKINCDNCCGLCCIALYYTKMDGFPEDKLPGKPCHNLGPDFKCKIHNNLIQYKLKGCVAYDCFGAGQKVTQDIFRGLDWKTNKLCADLMFKVFLIVYQLHQMLWYLIEASTVITNQSLQNKISILIDENIVMTELKPEEIIELNIEEYRDKVNKLLKEVCCMKHSEIKINQEDNQKNSLDSMGKDFSNQNLDGKDFSMCLLIAANLEGCSLKGTNFLGADMRDANLRNTDLSKSIFLTQMQINTALGNSNTVLPKYLSKPITWC